MVTPGAESAELYDWLVVAACSQSLNSLDGQDSDTDAQDDDDDEDISHSKLNDGDSSTSAEVPALRL